MNAVLFDSRANAAERARLPASAGNGSLVTVRGGSLSGRPTCRIYPIGRAWGLKLERTSAWLAGSPLPRDFRYFKSLASAIGYAEFHGLDYRIIRPSALFAARQRLTAKADQLSAVRCRAPMKPTIS